LGRSLYGGIFILTGLSVVGPKEAVTTGRRAGNGEFNMETNFNIMITSWFPGELSIHRNKEHFYIKSKHTFLILVVKCFKS